MAATPLTLVSVVRRARPSGVVVRTSPRVLKRSRRAVRCNTEGHLDYARSLGPSNRSQNSGIQQQRKEPKEVQSREQRDVHENAAGAVTTSVTTPHEARSALVLSELERNSAANVMKHSQPWC
ncbi:hypothetical protein EVAR_79786_1 [Eumeta japonica]|uniref:Uncharacterized protein n=1 Tax=Eumeta variegata TaxID=151549 RepID=A0A4C1WSM8_EUMVA|nr:hypothetical protein EVAR_79786_1 [Eumeta japonica]